MTQGLGGFLLLLGGGEGADCMTGVDHRFR